MIAFFARSPGEPAKTIGIERVKNLDAPYLTFNFARAYGVGSADERINQLDETESKRFDYIRLNSSITRKEFEEEFGLETKTAERQLARFTELGLIKRVGAGPQTHYEVVE